MTLLPFFDLSYALDCARFSCSYTHLGQIPEAFASVAFEERPKLREMLLLGGSISAQEAKEAGLVTDVVLGGGVGAGIMEEIVPR